MKKMIETRPIRGTDYKAIVNLAEALPDWFDEDVRRRAIPIDIAIVTPTRRHSLISSPRIRSGLVS